MSANTPVDGVARECDILCRWVVGEPADPDVIRRYVEAHRHLGSRLDAVDTPVAFARRSVFAAGLADAWTRVFRPTSLLRRKLTLLVAVLECRPETAAAFEAGDRRQSLLAVVALAAPRGLGFVLRLALATLVIGPLALVAGRRADPSP